MTRCSVYLRHGSGRYRGAAGYCQDAGNITEDVRRQESGFDGDRFSQEVITTEGPVVLHDALNDPRPHHRTMTRWDVRAMLGVPLVFDDEVIGLIFVDRRGREHDFTPATSRWRCCSPGCRHCSSARPCSTTGCAGDAEIARKNAALAFLEDARQTHRSCTGRRRPAPGGASAQRPLGQTQVLTNDDFDVLAWAAPAALNSPHRSPGHQAPRSAPPPRSGTLAALAAGKPSAVFPAQLAVGTGTAASHAA